MLNVYCISPYFRIQLFINKIMGCPMVLTSTNRVGIALIATKNAFNIHVCGLGIPFHCISHYLDFFFFLFLSFLVK